MRSTRLVDHVNRLVRQFPVAHVTRRKLHRRFHGSIGVAHIVEVFVIGLQAFQNLNRILNRRLVHIDLLEPAHQGAVLFEVLAIFLVGGRTDATQLAARKRGLEQIGSIHRPAAGRTRTDHGVDFIYEHDGTGHALDLFDDRLDALFKIAAIARSGQKRAHIQLENGASLQHIRHFALDDLARQSLGNGGFANARIANKQRIILGTPAQNLDGAVHFRGAPDQGINLAALSLLVEVDAVSIKCGFTLFLGRVLLLFGALILIDTAHGPGFRSAGPLGDAMGNVIHGIIARHILFLQEICGMALAFGKYGDEHIGSRHFFATR